MAIQTTIDGCMFFEKLPKELRDLCYQYAFASDSDENGVYPIIPLGRWMENERTRRAYNNRRAQAFTPKQAKPCPLLPMIVNKQFYNEAAAQWLHQTTIKCNDTYDFNSIVEHSKALKTYMAHFKGTWSSSNSAGNNFSFWSDFKALKKCKAIRTLHFTVTEDAFRVFESRMCCVDDYSDADFWNVQEVRDLIKMGALQTVKLDPEESKLAASEQEKGKWKGNVEALEGYINRMLKERDARKEKEGEKEGRIKDFMGKGKKATEEESEYDSDDPLKRARKRIKRRMSRFEEVIGEAESALGLPERPTKRVKRNQDSGAGTQRPKRFKPASGAASKDTRQMMGSANAQTGVAQSTHRDCGTLTGFARQHPSAAALMTTALALSVVNSLVLARQLF